MDMALELQELLRSALSAIPRTVSADQYMEIRQQIRVQIWIGALQVAGRHQGKCFPTQEQRASDQRALRMPFLGEQPQEQWVAELDRLVQQEIELDNRYRALQWQAEDYLGETTECSPEGYDFGGPGLLWESLTDGFVFDEGEPTLEDLRDYREAMLGLAGVSELTPDLEYLIRKEQHLERAYRELLEQVQQHALKLASEMLEMAGPKAEVMTGQSSANLCPAPTSSGFYGQEMVNPYPQTPVPETGELLNFSMEEEEQPGEPSAVELDLEDGTIDLSIQPTGALEDLCKASGFSGCFPVEQCAAGQNATVLCPQLQLEWVSVDGTAVSTDNNPAEALATGQRVQDLCPTAAAVLEVQGEEVVVTPEQHMRIEGETIDTSQLPFNFVSVDGIAVSTDGNPAEALATGQNAAGLCPPLTDGVPVKVDGTSVSTDTTSGADPAPGQEDVSQALEALGDCHLATVSICIPQGCCAIGPDPQQHDGVSPATLTSLQRLTGHQEEGTVYISPPQQGHLMREAEVGWVSTAALQNICLGYCVGTDIGGPKLLTNFGVNPSGVSSCVSLLPKGEMCDGSHFENLGGSLSSGLEPSYV